jgi:hypothetical protein
MTDSTLASDSTFQGGGGLQVAPGSTSPGLAGVLFLDDDANVGGAIDMENAGALNLQNCQLTGNVAAHGGAIDFAATGPLGGDVAAFTIAESTFNGNRSLADGGALSLNLIAAGGNLFDDTFAFNATGTGGAGAKGSGGAIYYVGDGTSTVNLTNLTINGNTAAVAGGGIDQQSGGLSVLNTIIAENVAAGLPSDDTYVGGTLTDGGGNVLGTTAGSNNKFTKSPIVANPGLGPLVDNGGVLAGAEADSRFIPTEAIFPGSPAFDKGIATGAPTSDERIFPRPGGPAVPPSIGAYWPQYASTATANQIFVENVYEVLLNRAADPAGLVAATNYLKGGGTPRGLVQVYQSSTEYLDDEATTLYQRYLGRAPSATETGIVAGFLKSGTTAEQLAAALIGSPEFFQDYGGTNDGFIEGAFETVLGRTPSSPAELTAWDQALAGGTSRGTVATFLLTSGEYIDDLTVADFEADLGIVPTASDLAAFLNAAKAGVSSTTLAAIALASSFAVRT